MKKNVETESKKPLLHREREEKYLRCNLTPEELDVRTVELTGAIDAHAEAEDEKKAVMADLKARAEKAAAEVARLNNIVRNRYEMRQVECETVLDFDNGRITTARKDNGEFIEDREMRIGERERQSESWVLT